VSRQTALQAEVAVIDQELTRLAAGVAQGGDLKVLLEGIRAREQRRRTLQEELAGLQGLRPVTAGDLQQLQQDVEARLSDWRGLLSRQITQSRQILKKLLVGRIVFRQTPDGGYEFSGEASLGRILSGIVCTKAGVAPTRTAHQAVGPFEVYFEVLALVPLDPVTTPRTDCPSL
jgi:hypothetical protein